MYDIDLFDNDTSVISSLKSSGKKVICYFSGGSYENWRTEPSGLTFLESDKGNSLDGWAGERWLDIRSSNVRAIMAQRLDLAKTKGCDGVEPDNMDGYTNNPGFNLTYADQIDYNKFIANEAHQRGLSVGLKNDLDQIKDLVDYFDFAINEECFIYNECDNQDQLHLFIDAGKAVFSAEYDMSNTTTSALCAEANSLQFSTLILPLDLDDSSRHSCL